MDQRAKHIETMLLEAVYGSGSKTDNSVLQYGLAVLPVLAKHLTQDLQIEILERFEDILKSILRTKMGGALSGDTARQLACFQKDLGFLFKYKSYAIKASTPFGYAIFVQNEKEGFSFQQHRSYKTEVFHILEVKPGGYVFICDYQDWARNYERESFSAWLSGQPDDRYDQYVMKPNPGDVYVIDRLNVVHTAIGCVLEEFATVSTDMVDRLHDQNTGKRIPAHFNRRFAQEQLRTIQTPKRNCLADYQSKERPPIEIVPQQIPGGQVTPLARTSEISASAYSIAPAQTSELQVDPRCPVTIYISAGAGRVILGERKEVSRLTPPTITVSAGDLLMVPPGSHYGFVNDGPHPLELSEHKVPPQVALA